MFRHASTSGASTLRFPRIRGDVPDLRNANLAAAQFSPHTRGCSRDLGVLRPHPVSFPRIRGDVPQGLTDADEATLFSPHTRGCSAILFGGIYVEEVFPAYAGMFQVSPSHTTQLTSFPRIRGDVPVQRGSEPCINLFSPHTRGCSSLG